MVISPFVIWVGLILGFTTFGIGLFAPVAFIIFIGWHAYTIDDKHRHSGGFI